jgi:hypothetical protein
MSKFVTKNIELVDGKQQFKQLIIVDDKVDAIKLQAEIAQKEINGQEVDIDGVLDIYQNSLEVKYESSFRGIVAIMNRVANGQSVASEKFKDVTPEKELTKEYEFKYQDLRVYAIKIFNGKLILLCGFKNQQHSDYSEFRSLKKKYLESIQGKEKKK